MKPLIFINKTLILCLFILFSIYPLYSQQLPSDKDYKQLHSQHFTIIYYTDKFRAKKILNTAEIVHDILADKFHIDDDIHTYIVLTDSSDLANGLATILPDNVIIIYDTPPELFTQISILNYFNWLKGLIIHEYTHILHINQSKDIFSGLKTIGLKYASPNLLLPLSSIEGLAVGMETLYTPMGRARSSYKDMVLRTSVYENNIPSIDEISIFANKIPSGYGPYIWGGSFHYYLLNKISEENLLQSYYENSGLFSSISGMWKSDFSTCFCSTVSCFPLNSIIENKTSKSYYTHYDEWITKIKRDYKIEINNINNPTIPELFEEIRHFWNIYDIMDYNDIIYFSGFSPHTGYGVYKYNEKSKELTMLIEDMLITDLLVYEGYLFFMGMKIDNNINQYFMLYRYDFNNKTYEPYKNLKRITDLATRNDKFLLVQNKETEKWIIIMDYKTGKSEPILKLDKYEEAYDLTFNNDNEFYFIGKKENDYFDIYHYNIYKKELNRLTKNPSIELSLFYSEDESNLYFISDFNSRFNFYKYNISAEKFIRLTDFITGAVRFTKFKNDYYASYYKSHGFTIAKLNRKNFKNIEVPYNDKTDFNNFTPITTTITNKSTTKISKEENFSYFNNLFSNIIPIPTFFFSKHHTSPGILLYFSDVLFRNSLQLNADYNFKFKKWSFSAEYNMIRNTFNYNINASYSHTGKKDDIKRNKIINGKITYKKIKFIKNFFLFSGISYHKRTELSVNNLSTYYNSLFAGVHLNNTVSYLYSNLPEKGWDTTFTFRTMKKWLSSTYNLDILNINLNKYYKTFFLHHILKFNIKSGILLNNSSQMVYTISGFNFSPYPSIYEIPMKGYSYIENDGKNYLSFHTSYNFPLIWVERSIKNMPILFSNLWMNIYYEAANTYNNANKLKPLQIIGSEFHFIYKIFYRIKMDNTHGIAYELQKDKQLSFYSKLSIRF